MRRVSDVQSTVRRNEHGYILPDSGYRVDYQQCGFVDVIYRVDWGNKTDIAEAERSVRRM